MRIYEEGYKLAKDEWLLKIRPADPPYQPYPVGFYAKLNKDGSLRKSFVEWGESYKWDYSSCTLNSGSPRKKLLTSLPIYVVEEKLRSGWKLHKWRFGQSQNWASLIHPDGYTLEVYLNDFLEIIQNYTLVNGELKYNLFKWDKHKLVTE